MSKIIFKKLNDRYLVESKFYSPEDFYFDDFLIPSLEKAWASKVPHKIEQKVMQNTVLSYGGLSYEEYSQKFRELGYFEEDLTEIQRAKINLDVATFKENHQPIYGEIEKITSIPFEVWNFEGKTDNKFIRPLRLIGATEKSNATEPLYYYIADIIQMIRDAAAKYNFTELSQGTNYNDTKGRFFAFSKKDSYKYFVINGTFGSDLYDRTFSGISYGTYEECLARYNEHYNLIDTCFAKVAKIVDGEGIAIDKSETIKFLDVVVDRIKQLQIKVNSIDKKSNLLKLIENFRKDL